MRRVPLALAALVGAAALALAPAAGAGAWSAPVRVSPPDRAAYGAASIAAGSGGAALAAWVRTPAGAPLAAGRVQVAARRAGRGWGRPRTLSGPGASLTRVALTSRGDAAAVWRNGGLIVAAVRRGHAGPWRPGRVAEAGAPVQELAVALDRRGRATVVWIEQRVDGFQVRLATSDAAGAEWSVRAARLATPGPEPPSLALSPGRGALAAWVDDGRVLASRTVAGAFERPVEMSEADGSSAGTALGGSGSALVSWSVHLPGGTEVLQAAGRPAAAPRWGAAEDVGIGGAPAVALNSVGDAVVVWGREGAGGDQLVEASTRRGGGLWRATTVAALHRCDCTVSATAAAVDGGGTAVVSWRRDEGDAGQSGGAAALAPAGDRWEAAPISGGGAAGPPAVSAAATEGEAAAWSIGGPGGGVRAAQRR
jgi:hypothetical protein